MNKVDRLALEQIVEHERSTKLSINTYLSIIAISKLDKETDYPTIENFNIHKLYRNMKDKMNYTNESSVRFGVKRLFEQGFIDYLDEEKTTLIVLNSGAGHIPSDYHFKNRGYITLHKLFFEEKFFKLTLKAMKLAIMALSRLNNCAIEPVKVNFKSKKNPESFVKHCKTLKVNRLAHIRSAIEELRELFHISELDNNTVVFRLNTVSKAVLSSKNKLFKFTKDQLAKTEKMLEEANKKHLKFKTTQVEEICEAICGYTMIVGRKTLKELCKRERTDIKNMFGYTKSILERLTSSVA